MKKLIILITAILLLSPGCEEKALKSDIDIKKSHVKITIVFNPEMYKSFLFKKFYPTYAIWAVDKKTGDVWTIYITGKAGTGDWTMADERPSSIPVWYGVKGSEKAKPKDLVDSISSATPSGKTVTHYWQVPDSMMNKRIDIYLEGNISFDYNDFYKKDAEKGTPGYSDVNGQPSLIWKAALKTGKNNIEVTPKIIGHGHVLGENHEINKDLSKITTAKEILQHIGFGYVAVVKK